ncbi:MAG: hypothetical protein A2236_08045, partial [Bacteroidetes bacterium RIFOXYA2_FULL_33_7]
NYSYIWDNGVTTQNVINLDPGEHCVTVTDDGGCEGTACVTIDEAPQLNVSTTSQNITCNGLCDGSASINVSGGTPPYSFLWSNVFVGMSQGELCPGNYSITVTDANYCHVATMVNIIEPEILTVGVEVTEASCVDSNGTATITVTGGFTPYAYAWNYDISKTDSIANNLFSGNYFITVSDYGGCTVLDTFIINNIGAAEVNIISKQNVSCNGLSDGILELSASGGISPYEISWSHDNLLTDFIADNLAFGNYVVTITDSIGCQGIHNFNITQPGSLFLSISKTDANCFPTGTATANPFGGTPPYFYQWNDMAMQITQTATNLTSGDYYITVSDTNGCEKTGNTHINYFCKNVIKGNIYNDENLDCVFDTSESGLSNVILKLTPGNLYANTNSLGEYSFSVDSGTYTIALQYALYNVTCPTYPNTITVNFEESGDTLLNNNFGINYGSSCNFDLAIHPGWTDGHPGFLKKYWFVYKYFGTGPIDAIVNFYYDPVLQFDSCTQGGILDSVEHKIQWSYNNLMPVSTWNWVLAPKIFFTVPVSVSIYDDIHTYFEMLPLECDNHPSNNILDIYEPITGSHDPNDKSVYPSGEGENGAILPTDSLLTYTIHFQNNGNDTAFTVVLIDTLSQFVDPATIVCGASSHPYEFELSEHGILKWTFNQILLVDSFTNEPASNGFVTYTIKQRADNPHGTVIANNADIYFDFNPPIRTNTTINTIDYYLSYKNMVEITNIDLVKIYPNPANEEIYIDLRVNSNELRVNSYKIFTIDGKKVLEGKLQNSKTRISTKYLENGIYFIEVGESVTKVVIMK